MPKSARRLAAMTVSSREWTVTSGRAGISAPGEEEERQSDGGEGVGGDGGDVM